MVRSQPALVVLLLTLIGGRADAIAPADTAAARAFAAEHHPELDALLDQLRRESPEAYDRAVADLDRARTRLDSLRANQPDRYAAAMEEWRLSSRIRLTLARMSIAEDPRLDQELDTLVRQRLDLRMQQSRSEADRLEKRLERLRQTLANYEENPEDAVRREVAAAKRSLRPRPQPATPTPTGRGTP